MKEVTAEEGAAGTSAAAGGEAWLETVTEVELVPETRTDGTDTDVRAGTVAPVGHVMGCDVGADEAEVTTGAADDF